jgi:hypothetical protein
MPAIESLLGGGNEDEPPPPIPDPDLEPNGSAG